MTEAHGESHVVAESDLEIVVVFIIHISQHDRTQASCEIVVRGVVEHVLDAPDQCSDSDGAGYERRDENDFKGRIIVIDHKETKRNESEGECLKGLSHDLCL